MKTINHPTLGLRNDACDNCMNHQAMHQGNEDLCCECYVLKGNPPADWHKKCMEIFNQITPKAHKVNL